MAAVRQAGARPSVARGAEVSIRNFAGAGCDRAGKKYPTQDSLTTTMVQSCVTYFDIPWFEEEVQAVSDDLNHTYYKYRQDLAESLPDGP